MATADPTILVIEDNDFDVKRIARGFDRLGAQRTIRHARDGVEALELLRGENGADRLVPPFVILLDLNMPRMGGIEFLDELRRDDRLSPTSVFVVSTSEFERDVEAAHRRNVSGYIVKPRSSEEMTRILSALSAFWDICLFAK